MKVMFSAGEASGDTHAASVAGALKNLISRGNHAWHGRFAHGCCGR